MGIINWARSRFNRKTERCQVVLEEKHHTDEQQQWRSHQDQAAGFLSIGTLGNVIGEPVEEDHPMLTHDLPEFTVEEVEKLQDVLAKFLSRAKSKSGAGGAEDGLGLPLDRFLNCPSSLDVDRRVLQEHDGGGGNLSPNTKVILSMAKDLLVNTGDGESRGSGIKNRFFKSLLRKVFVCHGGFASSRSYCLDNRTTEKSRRGNHSRREVDDEEEDCCRWDRTDSEFIVLEI